MGVLLVISEEYIGLGDMQAFAGVLLGRSERHNILSLRAVLVVCFSYAGMTDGQSILIYFCLGGKVPRCRAGFWEIK